MAETDSSHEPQNKPKSLTFTIWPPTQRIRDAVINHLIESLSTPSILSKRYGTIPQDEASDTAKQIEEEAFADAVSAATDKDDGVKILQVYSKEISKRMIDTVKSRSAPAADSTPLTESESKPSESPVDASEASSASGLTGEVSSVETES